MMNKTQLAFLGLITIMAFSPLSSAKDRIRVASFNVSMDATNYEKVGQTNTPYAEALSRALNSNHNQIKNIAEIIQIVAPDIILLNEFDNTANSDNKNHDNILQFLNQYLGQSQNKQVSQFYPYVYQGSVNTGVPSGFDLNNDGQVNQLPSDGFGFGYFPGHYGMVLLSKFPIKHEQIRTFQKFKWKDMPGALKPVVPETGKSWYSEKAWQQLRLSSKSHWDIPVVVNNKTLHILASHPTPPVFDGPEDRNGNRNHDEIRFWRDYISGESASYIYDDKQKYGGLKANSAFVILGDLNASTTDGDANRAGIGNLLSHDKVQDPNPSSLAAKQHSVDNPAGQFHTAYWRMRADYVLPSRTGINIKDAGVFWPEKNDERYRLIKDRAASSDHRLVWVDIELDE